MGIEVDQGRALKMAEASYAKFYKPCTTTLPPIPAAPNHQSVRFRLAAPLVSINQSILQTSGSAISRMLANIRTAPTSAAAQTLKAIKTITCAPCRFAYVPELSDDGKEVLDGASDKVLVPSMLDPNTHWDTERAQVLEQVGVTQYALDILGAPGESLSLNDTGGL